MNYMDYSDDNCENMFTHYQAVRMETAMNIFYPTLLNSMSCIPVGVEEVSDFQLSIYPNPSTGIISLDMFTTKNLGPELNVRITDLYGKTEYETVILDPAGYKHNLNVKELASGIHYVSFFNEKYKKTERISIVR